MDRRLAPSEASKRTAKQKTVKELATAAAAAAAAAVDDDGDDDDEMAVDAVVVGGEDERMRVTAAGKKGLGSGMASQLCCQAERCGADLTEAKRYHRRHKVCEVHSKAAAVMVAGLRQRFCQQCSRFHELSEFDDTKRSCRRRLAGHNERRRKTSSDTQGEGSSRLKACSLSSVMF